MQKQNMVFRVTADGSIGGLYFDDFNLSEMGDRKVERASEILFDESRQLWDVLLPSQDEPHVYARGFASYEVARTFEVEWLNYCMLHNIDPLTEKGASVCELIRRAMSRY
jgi:hypothetical protein